MNLIRGFFSEIDARWKPIGAVPIRLRIIGSAALMLQTDYERGTRDGDILEAEEITPPVRGQLLALAGPKSALCGKYRMCVELVMPAILFLPRAPIFHPVPRMPLKNFSAEVLDVMDVVVSKLKRLNQNDADDIRAMAERKLLNHKKLVRSFESAMDGFSTDARADDFPKYIENLHRIERDLFGVPESRIDLPDWMR